MFVSCPESGHAGVVTCANTKRTARGLRGELSWIWQKVLKLQTGRLFFKQNFETWCNGMWRSSLISLIHTAHDRLNQNIVFLPRITLRLLHAIIRRSNKRGHHRREVIIAIHIYIIWHGYMVLNYIILYIIILYYGRYGCQKCCLATLRNEPKAHSVFMCLYCQSVLL